MGRTVGKIIQINKTWLTKKEAMTYLGCGENYLQKLRDNAEVSFSRDGKMIWYDLESIDRFLRRKKVI